MTSRFALSCGIVALAASATAAAQPPAAPGLASLSGRTSGDEGDGFAFAAVVAGAAPPLLYVWDFGDGTAPVAKFDASDMNHRYAEDGTYRVSLQVEGVGGSARRELEVVVRPAPPKIHLLLAERESDGSYRFTAEASDPGEQDELTYRWELGDGSPPREGVDLAEVRHRFERDGAYTVTLTVSDEDALVATATRRVLVGSAVDVEVTGALQTRVRTGKGPTSVCPVPLGDGGCGLHLQYWDDVRRSYLFLQLYGKPLLEPRSFPLVDADERKLARGTPVAEATAIVAGGFSSQDYETYKEFLGITDCRNAGKLPVAGSVQQILKGGMKGIGRDLLRSLPGGRLFGKSEPQGGGGSGAGFVAFAGTLAVESADEERVAGRLVSTLRAEKNGRRVTVEAEGSFAAVFDEFADQFLSLCEPGPFELADRFPQPDAEMVDFARPDLWVSVTRPLAPESISTDALWLETLAEDGQYERVPSRLLHDGDRSRVHLLPIGGLDPARAYRVRLAAGEGGLESRAGATLAREESWRFSTMPDLYRTVAGGATSAAVAAPAQPVFAVLRGRPGATPAELALQLAPPPAATPAQLDLGKDTIEPRVSCNTFQSSRNMPLVRGKTTAFRVYLHWDVPNAPVEAQVRKLAAEVELVDGGGQPLPGLALLGAPDWYQHQSLWSRDTEAQRLARHTANFSGWKADPTIGRVVARATLKDVTGTKHVFEGECPIDHWDVADPSLSFGVFLLPVGSWAEQPPPKAEVESSLRGSLDFLEQNLPVGATRFELWRAILQPESAKGPFPTLLLPESSPDYSSHELSESLELMLRLRDAIRREQLRFDVIVGLYPENVSGGLQFRSNWNFEGFSYTRPDGVPDPDGLFPEPTVRVRKHRLDLHGAMTLAHEVGHAFGLRHLPPTKGELAEAVAMLKSGASLDSLPTSWRIEGLRVAADGSSVANKSILEGNGDGGLLLPLLAPGDQPLERVFITNDQYVQAMREFERYFAMQ